MQKIILFALVALSLAQNPTPIPLVNVDLSDFDGLWYVPWSFNEINPNEQSEIACAEIVFSTGSGEGTTNFTIWTTSGQSQSQAANFTVANVGNTSWSFDGTIWNWISVDVVSFSWAVFASGSKNAAILISRTPTVTTLVSYAATLLLQGEGFSVNSANSVLFNSMTCPSTAPLFDSSLE